MAAKLSSWKGDWPDIITMISAHKDQGSMKRKRGGVLIIIEGGGVKNAKILIT